MSGTLQLAQITLGYSESCGLTPAGVAWCWGGGVPAPLPGDFAFRKIGVGLFNSCGIVAPTRLYCWDNGGAPSYAGLDAADVAMGHTWNMVSGSLGTQAFGLSDGAPWHLRETAFPLQAIQVSSQDDTPCLIAPDAAVYCLGVNDNIEQFYQTTWEAIPPPRP